MAGPSTRPLSRSQWWRRTHSTCCKKQILLLLVWQTLLTFSTSLLGFLHTHTISMLFISLFLSYCFAPLIGWLADVRFGRYGVIKFGSVTSFLASILYYFVIITEESTLRDILLSISHFVGTIGFSCYAAAMLPFLSDQIIGATSDELSAVVRWNYWVQNLGICLSNITVYFYKLENAYVSSNLVLAVPLAVIIISDCLCQQWLDRTHKVTNPIKLIIQVLNYTRKHRYPERRSAFTYIDEEQPTRMDHGKEKFGGPFTEEEVEDVKTVLRLLPLVICLSLSVTILEITPSVHLFNSNELIAQTINKGVQNWMFPLLLIPLYQILLHRCFRKCSTSTLQCIGVGLFIRTLGHILLSVLGVIGGIVSDDLQRYVSCKELAHNATKPGSYMNWYWKIDSYILYGVGKTIGNVLLFEITIAQSPDKMKGLVIGIMLGFNGVAHLFVLSFYKIAYTLCYDLMILLVLVVLFVVFLVLSKRYTLRERNREINIQAIVEEHYERYMDQEEEYMRQQH